jgi:thiamine pyrophosphokinase
MSSHHIVREKQEPALLILGLENFSGEHLGQLLEWSPTIITTPLTAEKVIIAGIKIDKIFTNNTNEAYLQSDIELIEQDNCTESEAALKYLVKHGYPAVNVVTDELPLADYLLYVDQIDIVIYYNNKKTYAIKSGFSKWKPGGESIEILSAVNELRTVGLEQIDNKHYRTLNDGFFSLNFNAPFIFIAEEL